MGKDYAAHKGRSKDRFVNAPFRILQSDAWLSLKPTARAVWLEIMLRYNGSNNGKIPLSCREASQNCNISKNTASNAFDELIERGLIRIEENSSFDYKQKRSRRWRITHMACEGKPPTGEWRTWKPEASPQQSLKK